MGIFTKPRYCEKASSSASVLEQKKKHDSIKTNQDVNSFDTKGAEYSTLYNKTFGYRCEEVLRLRKVTQ